LKNINIFKEEAGATAVEYAIMASAIAGAIATIVVFMGLKVEGLFRSFMTAWK